MLAVIVNPSAGRGAGRHIGRRALLALQDADISHRLVWEDSPHTLSARVKDVLAEASVSLVIGGDGLVHALLQIPEFRAIPFSVLPAGTGNDFASFLGAQRDPVEHVRALDTARRHGTGTPFDALTVEPETGAAGTAPIWVGGSVALGLAARVNARANRARLFRGPLAYQVALLQEILRGRIDPYTVNDHTRQALLLSVFNLPSFGGGITLAPDASPADGLLDTVEVAPATRRRVLSLLPTLARAEHTTLPEVTITQARSIRVGMPAQPVYGDGEHLCDGVVRVTVHAGALRVITPQ